MAKLPKDPKDLKVEYSDQVNEKAADNPELAEALRDFTSRLRQAMHDLDAGKFSSHDEAMRSIGGEKVDPDEVPEEVMDEMEKRMSERKNAAMKQATPQIEPDVVEQVERTTHYPIMNIVKCMRISAMMLEIADGDNPNYSKLNQMQADLLRAAARDLATQYEAQLAEVWESVRYGP